MANADARSSSNSFSVIAQPSPCAKPCRPSPRGTRLGGTCGAGYEDLRDAPVVSSALLDETEAPPVTAGQLSLRGCVNRLRGDEAHASHTNDGDAARRSAY